MGHSVQEIIRRAPKIELLKEHGQRLRLNAEHERKLIREFFNSIIRLMGMAEVQMYDRQKITTLLEAFRFKSIHSSRSWSAAPHGRYCHRRIALLRNPNP